VNFRNQSKLGDLEIPGVGFVAHGEIFDVEDGVAESFLAQPDVYLLVDDAGEPIARAAIAETEYDPAGDGRLPDFPPGAYAPGATPLDPIKEV
jgi:hypothetical protein